MSALDLTLAAVRLRHGFLTAEEIAIIARLDRLRPLLVRCGGVRFTCGAQYFETMEKMVTGAGDYIRDVSLPTSDAAMKDDWKPGAEPATVALHLAPVRQAQAEAAGVEVRCACGKPGAWRGPRAGLRVFECDQCHAIRTTAHTPALPFHEGDCGGVFDGHNVTSDADPGL